MGQYTNRCEICIIIVKIKPLHAYLNHLAEKCQAHVAEMFISSQDLLFYLTDRSVLLPSHLHHYEHHLQNEREMTLV